LQYLAVPLPCTSPLAYIDVIQAEISIYYFIMYSPTALQIKRGCVCGS